MYGSVVVILSTLIALVFTVCTTDEDCQLNGVCKQSECMCDSGWGGDQCGVLLLVPVEDTAGFRQTENWSWGGTIVKDENYPNLYHLYASEMADHCTLSVWRGNSQIVHAYSNTSVTGPYIRNTTVIYPEAHNPQAIRAPDGTYLLFDSYGGPISCPCITKNCSVTQTCPCTPESPSPIPYTFHISHTPLGPWSPVTINVPRPCHSCNLTPSPALHPNGTLFIMFHCDADTTHQVCDLTMVSADHWKGPYIEVNQGQSVWKIQQSPGHPEDPFLWIDARGGWHVLVHNGRKGIHLFSKDGLSFVTANNNNPPYAFTADVTLVGGEIYPAMRRERPYLHFVGGRPTALVTSMEPPGGSALPNTFTHVQAIKMS